VLHLSAARFRELMEAALLIAGLTTSSVAFR
jgi:hypothetical protein